MAAIGFIVAVAMAITLGTMASYGIIWMILMKTDLLKKAMRKSMDLAKDMTEELLKVDITKTDEENEA